MSTEQEYVLLEKAASLWHKAHFPIAFTGAGISVPSGIPDFRSPGGLWSKYDPFEVASGHALKTNPEKVWQFLLETSDILDKAHPNQAHLALAELEQNRRLMGIITQNIDNLHQRAGSKYVIEYHGNFQRFYCQSCFQEIPLHIIQQFTQDDIPPYCERCGGLIRPDVVFFEESIPELAQNAAWDLVYKADCVLIAGTSGEVAPANILPRIIKENNGTLIEINLRPSSYGDITDVLLQSSIDVILPVLAEKILASSSQDQISCSRQGDPNPS
jgi:NAD-dependent deacetylase